MLGQTYKATVQAEDSTGAEAKIEVVIEVAPHRYDLNGNGAIGKAEVIKAVFDYFTGII